MNRINQKPRTAQRLPEPSGHGAYDRADTKPWEPGWQLPPCPATGPEVDAVILFASMAAAKAHLEKMADLGGDDESV